MRRVAAGRLRHWLTFEILVHDVDSDGAHVENWAPAFPVGFVMPAEVTALSGSELIAAAAQQSKVSHRLKIRYREGFVERGSKMRARSERGGIVFNIEAVIPDPDSTIRYLTLLASSGVSPGN